MKPASKVGLVAAGYVAALLIALAMVWIRVSLTSDASAQASSGMYAFADALLFVAVFGVCALVPTAGALFLLRPYRRFWMVLSAFGLGLASTGLTAAALFTIGRNAPPSSIATWADFSLLRILVAPLLTLVFLVCAVFSPSGSSRWALLAATVIEAAVSAYGGLLLLVPMLFRG